MLNSVLLAIFVAACALFTQDTPHSVIVAVLFLQGMLRALILLLMNIVGYSDLPDGEFAAASTISSMRSLRFAALF